MSLPGLMGAGAGPGGLNADGLGPGTGPAPGAAQGEAASEPFEDALRQVLDQVEADQRVAEDMGRRLAAGEVADLSQVMLASEKAYLSLATLVQVRNKLLEAYQEFMRMQM